jgi:hypothetical protein
MAGGDSSSLEGARSQESGVRSQESGVRSQESGVRSQESEVRSQESGVRSQESGVRSQESGVRSQESGARSRLRRRRPSFSSFSGVPRTEYRGPVSSSPSVSSVSLTVASSGFGRPRSGIENDNEHENDAVEPNSGVAGVQELQNGGRLKSIGCNKNNSLFKCYA